MSSQVDIANLAMTFLGSDRIVSFTEATENARKINVVYDMIRKEVLRAHPWNFAIARAQLAQLAPAPIIEYTYKYQLPSDCLRVIRITDGSDPIEDYKIEGRELLTDEGTVYIRYIKDATDPEQYDSTFVVCFATRLAAELAHSISADKNLAQLMWQLYENKLKLAKAQDGQESADSLKQNEDYWAGDGRN